MASTIQKLKLESIRLDGDTQPRATINQDVVGEYAEAMTEGATLPPVTVYRDGTDDWLADGFHRYHAHRKIGALTIDADVRHGSRREAVLHSVGANAAHGLQRTNDDKRRAVMTLLEDVEWSKWSDNQIAKACGVSNSTVSTYRKHLCESQRCEVPNSRAVERNGKTYEQDISNIGRNGKCKRGAKGKQAVQVSPPPVCDTVAHHQATPAEDGATNTEAVTPEVAPAPPQSDSSVGEEAFGDFDPLAELDAAQKEIASLQEQITALSSDDTAAALAKEVRTRQSAEARLEEKMNEVAKQDKELRKFGKLTKQLRDLLGVEPNSKIVGAVRALLKGKVA